MHRFERLRKAAGLALNKSKCVLIVLWGIAPAPLKQWLREHVPGAHLFAMADKGKLLGIWIGPGAGDFLWESPVA
eukprot:14837013-Heterocapsa_arctica.AAC.1